MSQLDHLCRDNAQSFDALQTQVGRSRLVEWRPVIMKCCMCLTLAFLSVQADHKNTEGYDLTRGAGLTDLLFSIAKGSFMCQVVWLFVVVAPWLLTL